MKPRQDNKSLEQELNYTERREQVARLYLEGRTQNELAARFGVNQSTISRDLEAIRKQWQEQALRHFDQIKSRELARIDRLEREYWEAWEESKADAETMKQFGTMDNEAGKIKAVRAEKTAKGQSGNPSFLSGVQWCIEQRLKIFGVYEAVKLRIDYSWRDELADAVRRGELTREQIEQEAPDLVGELFANV